MKLKWDEFASVLDKFASLILWWVVFSVVFIVIFAAGFACGFVCKGFSVPFREARVDSDTGESSGFILKEFRITAYCPCEKCCGEWADGITASGYKIKSGDKLIAAPREYSFGTIMNIPNYGRVLVKDRGGIIKNGKLDVFFATHEEALQWGVKYSNVKVYDRE